MLLLLLVILLNQELNHVYSTNQTGKSISIVACYGFGSRSNADVSPIF
jgi:hypothetical protein